MSNTPAKTPQLSQETQKQLRQLTAKLNDANEDLKTEVKQVISTLIAENITLKRENTQLKTDKLSKS
jgi:regulator of replication initiation timing